MSMRRADPRRARHRADGLRRRARRLLRELEPARVRRARGARGALRAGQPFALRRGTCCAACTTRCSQPQGKLVRVVAGEVFDVVVDLRRSSPTFGRWVGERLSAENRRMLWVPAGFAHGFLVLSDRAEFLYKTTDYYAPEHERTLLWNDPALGIAVAARGRAGAEAQGRRGHAARPGGNLPVIRVLVTGAGGQVGADDGARARGTRRRDRPTIARRSTSPIPIADRRAHPRSAPRRDRECRRLHRGRSRRDRNPSSRARVNARRARASSPPKRSALGALARAFLDRLRLRRHEARALRRGRRHGAARRVRAHEARGRTRGRAKRLRPRDPAHELGLRADAARTSCSRCCGSRRRATRFAWWTTSAARPRRARSSRARWRNFSGGASIDAGSVDAREGFDGPVSRDGRGRDHVARIRHGDLRGARAPLRKAHSRAPQVDRDHDGRVPDAREAPRLLGAFQREARSARSACASAPGARVSPKRSQSSPPASFASLREREAHVAGDVARELEAIARLLRLACRLVEADAQSRAALDGLAEQVRRRGFFDLRAGIANGELDLLLVAGECSPRSRCRARARPCRSRCRWRCRRSCRRAPAGISRSLAIDVASSVTCAVRRGAARGRATTRSRAR